MTLTIIFFSRNKCLFFRDATDTVEIFNMEDETINEGINIPFADYSFSACAL